ncbi:MAG: FKBP-type peptidyl-prolyl cis-trans isomerase [Ginsengibacter sp.]|jgi:FKBP-type peptidyl-prolyl cis-trans isomerase
MKRVLFISLIAAIGLNSCLKQDNKCTYADSKIVAPIDQQSALLDSLTAHGIKDAILHPSGFYYTVVNQGSGPGVVNLCSNVTVDYVGSFFNGQVFDSAKSAYFALGQVIPGWQKGVPFVNKGGDINLYIPPALAYGPDDTVNPNTGKVVIPGKSYLIFKIHVVNIQ